MNIHLFKRHYEKLLSSGSKCSYLNNESNNYQKCVSNDHQNSKTELSYKILATRVIHTDSDYFLSHLIKNYVFF